MIYIEAPEQCPLDYKKPRVFLAGGITGCRDWQAEVVEKLNDVDIILFNPRRAEFPIDDPIAANEQIKWEFDHFRKSSLISFWFSAETVQPIVLFELGTWLMHYSLMRVIYKEWLTQRDIVIGVDPGYQRKQDVYIQTHLISHNINIVETIDDLVDGIKKHVERFNTIIR